MQKQTPTSLPSLSELTTMYPAQEGAHESTSLIAQVPPDVLTQAIDNATVGIVGVQSERDRANHGLDAAEQRYQGAIAAVGSGDKRNIRDIDAKLDEIIAARHGMEAEHMYAATVHAETTPAENDALLARDIRAEQARLGRFARIRVGLMGALMAGGVLAVPTAVLAVAADHDAASHANTVSTSLDQEVNSTASNLFAGLSVGFGVVGGVLGGTFATAKFGGRVAGRSAQRRAQRTLSNKP